MTQEEEAKAILERWRATRRAHYQKNKARLRLKEKEYYYKNRDVRLKRMKAYREKKKSQASINEKVCGVTSINTTPQRGN